MTGQDTDASHPLAIRGRRLEGVDVIPNPDANAGFCALITYALNGVRLALERNRLPVVNFDRDNCSLFYDEEYGENVWEYYFEPVAGMSYTELKRRMDDGDLDPSFVSRFDARDLMRRHHSDPERVATFWASDVPEAPAEWMAAKRRLGREYVAKYVQVKPHVAEKVQGFVDKHFRGRFTFGAHVRGTDFAYAEPTPPEAYFEAIERLVQRKGLRNYGVFLATDQQQFVDRFQREYGSSLVTYDSFRGSGDVAPFRLRAVNPYRKGEDVLVDTLLLSRCDHVLKCAAAGGEYALWFGQDLECTDFALSSGFDQRDYHLLESAYLKLNVGGRGRLSLRARRIYTILVHYLRSRGVATLPRRAMNRVQRLLRDRA